MTPTEPRSASSMVERCADEMTERWAAGDRPRAEDYLARFPDLRRRPDAALDLIAEELALREEHGELVTADELAARFPEWDAQVRALHECQRALGPRALSATFPEPGDRLGDFRLLSELGRGAHGRVYLAAQPTLAGRPVVLKVGPDDGREHLLLARLQHSHIVPLYSVHDFPDRGLRALCLPYFGGATLAEVQARLWGRHAAGKDLLAAIRSDDTSPACGPAWGFLERASLADAVCWIGTCLGDALQYAHDRGLLHFDLKPTNVLIAADGVPMLLDFHLARPPVAAGEPAPAWIGGTVGYMAPEHRAAVEAVRDGRPVPESVDARADVYSLGVLLTEFVQGTGCRVSPGLADVLARCTAPAAVDRYRTAGDVAADLRRHLSDLPLKGVRNRSLGERWAKWRRRRAYALPLGLALAALAAVGVGVGVHSDNVADKARAALRAGRSHAAGGRFAEAAEVFRGGEVLLDGMPFHPALRSDLRDARQAAERATAADDLHAFAELVRQAAAEEGMPPDQVRLIERQCRDVWGQRDALAGRLAGQPTPDRDERWRTDLLDVAVLAADLDVRSAPPAEGPDAVRRALATLADAETLLGPATVLDLERARYGLGAGPRANAIRRTGWDHFVVGRSHLAAGDVRRAATELEAAADRDPRLLWAHYLLGTCHLRLNQPTEAVAAFAACVALAPGVGWCPYNRGLAYAAAGRPDAALADFDRAVALDPNLAAAYVGRAGIHQTAGRHTDALADLRRAAEAGAPAADVLYRTAVVQVAANDRPAAARSLRECLAVAPDHAGAKALLSQLPDGW